MVTVEDTRGAPATWAARPVTVRCSDDMPGLALAGPESVKWSCRGAEFASTVPRSQEEVPSELPHPKLKTAFPAAAGSARSLKLASRMLPPAAQKLIVQPTDLRDGSAGCPLTTLTQSLATEESWLALTVVAGPLAVGDGVAYADEVLRIDMVSTQCMPTLSYPDAPVITME
jgi:hypothetical protein